MRTSFNQSLERNKTMKDIATSNDVQTIMFKEQISGIPVSELKKRQRPSGTKTADIPYQLPVM